MPLDGDYDPPEDKMPPMKNLLSAPKSTQRMMVKPKSSMRAMLTEYSRRYSGMRKTKPQGFYPDTDSIRTPRDVRVNGVLVGRMPKRKKVARIREM